MRCSKCRKNIKDKTFFCDKCAMGPLKILYVDNEESLRKWMTGFLTCLNHQVKSVASTLEAIEELRLECFDLVITDEMPDMSSQKLSRIVKDTQSRCPAQDPTLKSRYRR